MVYLHNLKIIHRGQSKSFFHLQKLTFGSTRYQAVKCTSHSTWSRQALRFRRIGRAHQQFRWNIRRNDVLSRSRTDSRRTVHVSQPLIDTSYQSLTSKPRRITSDVWSTALTVLEVALNRFPFPSVGEAPLNGPIELLTYLIKMDSPVKVLLADEAEGEGVKYTNAFKDFVGVWSVLGLAIRRTIA